MVRGKKHSPEQIVDLLRQLEVAIANGKTTPQACKEAEQTYNLPYGTTLMISIGKIRTSNSARFNESAASICLRVRINPPLYRTKAGYELPFSRNSAILILARLEKQSAAQVFPSN
jgi:hypothetical protein